MKVDDCVYVRHNADYDHEYGLGNSEKRLAHDQRVGRIVDFHDAHGYSFVVGFTDQQTAGYDIDELTVVTQRQWTDHVLDRVGVRELRYVDEYRVDGRGLLFVVNIGDDPPPKPRDRVRINGCDYRVTSIDVSGRHSPHVAIITETLGVS